MAKLSKNRNGLVYETRFPLIQSLVILPGRKRSAPSVLSNLESYDIRLEKNSSKKSFNDNFLVVLVWEQLGQYRSLISKGWPQFRHSVPRYLNRYRPFSDESGLSLIPHLTL